jgi:hypothetical protein
MCMPDGIAARAPNPREKLVVTPTFREGSKPAATRADVDWTNLAGVADSERVGRRREFDAGRADLHGIRRASRETRRLPMKATEPRPMRRSVGSVVFALLVATADPASACTICSSDTSLRVRALLGIDWGTSLAAVAGPVPVLLVLVGAVRQATPWLIRREGRG